VAGNALAADVTWAFTITISGSIPLDGLANLSYNASNNRINTSGFEYDTAGNQTRAVINGSGTQQQYRYDCAGRLAQALDASGNVLAIHVYGENNQRIMSIEGGVTKFFAWAGGQIIAEYEASGANALVWKTSYVYLGGRLLATTSGAGGTETRFHHPDRLGTRLTTDAGGTVVSEQWSLPFGNMQPFTSVPGGANPYQHPTLGNPSKKRFTSYDRSDATGLDYAVNRFYSPQQGRFTQVDPIGMGASSLSAPQTLNMYAYCGNDPINHVDPAGLFFGFIIGALIAIGTAIVGVAKKVAKRVIARVRSSGPGARTPPFNPGNTPSISLGDLLGKIRIGIGVNVSPITPPFLKRSLLSSTSGFLALAQQRSDCGRFVDFLVGKVEISRSDTGGGLRTHESRTYDVGHGLLLEAKRRDDRLGSQTFDGFRANLTTFPQNDGVYQHVLGHAGAVMIGNRELLINVRSGNTGNRTATTGTELTNFALEEDERQRDNPTPQHPRAEAEAEIEADHAGRLVGGHMMRGLSGEINSEQLRQTMFGILCVR
jgi:RHS repeat-associated protein